MQKRAKAFRDGEPYEKISQIASESINRNFNAQGRPKWRKRKGQYSWPILDKTGRMRDQAELSALQNWRHGGRIHTKDIGSPEYGYYHQYTGIRTKTGSRIEKVKRPFVVFQPDERLAMGEAFNKAFRDPR